MFCAHGCFKTIKTSKNSLNDHNKKNDGLKFYVWSALFGEPPQIPPDMPLRSITTTTNHPNLKYRHRGWNSIKIPYHFIFLQNQILFASTNQICFVLAPMWIILELTALLFHPFATYSQYFFSSRSNRSKCFIYQESMTLSSSPWDSLEVEMSAQTVT